MVAVAEKPSSMLGGPFFHKQAKKMLLKPCRCSISEQLSVRMSIVWSDGLTIEHLLMTECGQGHELAVAQASRANSQQKWKHR